MERPEDTQSQVIALLAEPATHGLPGEERVTVHETHVSVVFLAGERAFKLKKAVKFPYLDFSTLEARRQACEDEVAINRRTAPDLYLGLVPVTARPAGGLAVGGDGRPVEWLVEMRRFPGDGLFSQLAEAGGLGRRLMEELADRIAEFHAAAAVEPVFGGAAGTRMIIDNNDASFRSAAGQALFAPAEVDALTEASRARRARSAALLDARRAAGRVRHCHGDLHLANICLWQGRPTLFDAIEFNREFSRIDVLYDLAFLLMDLDHRGFRRLAAIILNRYLDRAPADGPDLAGLALLPLFLSMRAAVRAHVGASQAAGIKDADKRRARGQEARAYFDLAQTYLAPPPPVVVAVGGLSGSGKSRLAREIASYLGAAPGARIVRTDAMRKRLAGIDLFDRLAPESYTPEASARTYAACYAEARAALAAGQAVVFDAVSAKPEERIAIEALAREAGAPFLGLWATAPLAVRLERVSTRDSNVSDAGVEVAQRQEDMDLGHMTWTEVDTSGRKKDSVARGLDALRAAHILR